MRSMCPTDRSRIFGGSSFALPPEGGGFGVSEEALKECWLDEIPTVKQSIFREEKVECMTLVFHSLLLDA